jgi:hypothetical protein
VRLQPLDKSGPQSSDSVALEVHAEHAAANPRVFIYHGDQPKLLENVADSANGILQTRVPLDSVKACLEGQRRSLWLAIGDATDAKSPEKLSSWYCFDLPPVDLAAQTRVSRGKQGVQIKQKVSNLLPGYRVLYSRYQGDGTQIVPRELPTEGEAPYLLASKDAAGADELTIQWRAAPSGDNKPVAAATPSTLNDGASSWLLYVVNIDGSRSRTLLLDWNGTKFTNIREFQEAIPAPIDELVTVPDVSGMTLDRAAVVIADAGL